MNILFVTGAFESNGEPLTGMPRYLYKTCKYLNRHGHCARIVAASNKERKWKYGGVTIHSVKVHPILREAAWIKYGLNAIIRECALQKEVAKLCKTEKVDIIQYTGWFGVGLLHRGTIPAVMRMSSYCKVQLASNHSKKEVTIISFMERLAAKRMNAVISPSYIVGNQLQKDIKKKVHVIETPFWEDCYEKDWDWSVVLNGLSRKKYLLFFGRLSVNKGILTIADMIYDVLSMHSDLHFVFAGIQAEHNGVNTFRILKEKALEHKDRVVYLGNLMHEKLLPVIKEAYAVVLPSLVDNLPNSCQEAMYHEKVVIGTWDSSLDQLIEDRVSGFLSLPGDGGDLLRAVNMAMSLSEEDKRKMELQAAKTIERLKPELTIGRLVSLYKQVIDME